MLKLALKQGLDLDKIHSVIKFDQEAWMKEYIATNTTHRTNAVFDKTMKNKRKNRDIKLITTQKKRMKLAREPNLYGIKHFTNDLSAIEMRKTNIFMDKLIYLGFTILELSKACNV